MIISKHNRRKKIEILPISLRVLSNSDTPKLVLEDTKWVCWGSGSLGEENEEPMSKVGEFNQSPLSPILSLCNKRKKERLFDFCFVYLRFRRMSAAAAATMMMTAAPIATYVVMGIALVGGTTAELGDGEAVFAGVGASV
jgi:hypothetical protein